MQNISLNYANELLPTRSTPNLFHIENIDCRVKDVYKKMFTNLKNINSSHQV